MALAVACSGEEQDAPGLYLDLDTDLAIPLSVNEVGLFVTQLRDGARTSLVSARERPLYDEATGSYRVKFAASLAVQADPDNPDDRVQVRFVGFRADGTASVMREARVAVPSDKRQRLRVPLLFVNEGSVIETGTSTTPQGGLQLQQAETDDPFLRYRTARCGDEQTLGDDGQCRSIDVDASELLPEGSSPPACFSVANCFGGPRGAREVPLRACRAVVPPIEGDTRGDRITVGLPHARGYATGGATLVQPLSTALYRFDPVERSVTLLGPACERAEQNANSSLWLSVKCAPLEPSTPVCAPWQLISTEQAPDNGGFAGDPPPPSDADADATFDDASDAADGDASVVDASDAGDGGDGGAQEFTRELTFDSQLSLRAFVADADGRLIAFTSDSSNANLWYANGGQGSVTALSLTLPAAFQSTSERPALELGGGNPASVYLFHAPEVDSPNGAEPFVLKPNDAGSYDIQPVLFGTDPGTCTAAANSAFTVGTHAGRTVAGYDGQGGFLFGGTTAAPDRPDCFVGAASGYEISDERPYRGASAFGAWRTPLGHSTDLLSVTLDPITDATITFTDDYPMTLGATYQQSIVDLGSEVVVVLKDQDAWTHLFTLAPNPNVEPEQPQFLVTSAHSQPGLTNREVFAGHGIVCARFTVDGGAPDSVRCFQRGGAGFVEVLSVSGLDGDDPHLYGDTNYLYYGRLCGSNIGPAEAGKRLQVRAIPWAQVPDFDVATFDQTCPSTALE